MRHPTALGSSAACFVQNAALRSGHMLGADYLACLERAFLAAPPIFSAEPFGMQFRLRGRDATWVASLLASNSYMEGYSATRLWQYAATLSDTDLARNMNVHASDEARHSRMFSTALFKTFPSLLSEDLRKKMSDNTPTFEDVHARKSELDFPTQVETVNSMILINLFEIKALYLIRLTSPVVLAHAPEHNRPSLQKLFKSIEFDEARHINYSADFLQNACNRGLKEHISVALREFQQSLNHVSNAEVWSEEVSVAETDLSAEGFS